jgi:hypothetical protein
MIDNNNPPETARHEELPAIKPKINEDKIVTLCIKQKPNNI